jgi:hypothetical protein
MSQGINLSNRRHVISLMLFVLLVLALATAKFDAPLAQSNEGTQGWTPVTLVYHSDVKGKIEPCG